MGGVWVGAVGRGLVLKRNVSLNDCFGIIKICESYFYKFGVVCIYHLVTLLGTLLT